MDDCIEAHYGEVVLLRVSQNSEDHGNKSVIPASQYLVSSGTDCLVKVWKVVHPSNEVVSLDMWSVVKLVSVPQDLEMIGYTIGLVMDNNSLMTCK